MEEKGNLLIDEWGMVMKKMEKWLFCALLAVLMLSMASTELLLLLQGRWREALPLHLCSLAAIASAVMAVRPMQRLLDFLWYLGIPGASLALIFPAPASSVFQELFNAAYVITHAMILAIPGCRIAFGMRPGWRRTPYMMLFLLGTSIPIYAVNRMLGTNFLFLASPPPGTPLALLFSFGRPVYLIALFCLMLLCCMGMDALAGYLFKRSS